MPYSFIGVSCRCFYARLKKSANDTPASADEGSMKYIDKSCQTDFSIPSHPRFIFQTYLC